MSLINIIENHSLIISILSLSLNAIVVLLVMGEKFTNIQLNIRQLKGSESDIEAIKVPEQENKQTRFIFQNEEDESEFEYALHQLILTNKGDKTAVIDDVQVYPTREYNDETSIELWEGSLHIENQKQRHNKPHLNIADLPVLTPPFIVKPGETKIVYVLFRPDKSYTCLDMIDAKFGISVSKIGSDNPIRKVLKTSWKKEEDSIEEFKEEISDSDVGPMIDMTAVPIQDNKRQDSKDNE